MSDDSPLNWQEVRERLEAARQANGPSTEADEQQRRQRLRERARELARPVARERAPTERELITFAVGAERYALESHRIVEIAPLREVIPLPGARSPIVGLMSWRGSILVVSELRALVGAREQEVPQRRYVVVVGGDERTFGLVVDGFGEVVAAAADDLSPLPEGVAVNREAVAGVLHDVVMVLNDDALLRLHAQLS